MFVKTSEGQSTAYVCKHTNVTGSELEIVFKYFRDGNTRATGLTSYDASAPPNISTAVGGPACSTQTLNDDIFTLQYDVDVNGVLPCGVVKDTVSPMLYRVAIVADGTSTYYTFACNISDLQLPKEVAVDSFATEQLMTTGEFTSKPIEASLGIFTPDDRPVSDVTVGEYVKLRFTHEIKEEPIISTSFGTLFYTAYPVETNTLLIKIYTLSESWVDVQVNVSFDGATEGFLVSTRKLTPAIVPVTLNYAPRATATEWFVVDYGVKIQSLGEDIGVVIEKDGNEYFTVYPVDVSGKQYRLLSYYSTARCLIVATEDNTSVTFDLSNYDATILDIAGIDFSSASEATVVIHEYEAIELMCTDYCVGLVIKSSKKCVTLLRNHPLVLQIPETNKLYRNFIIPKSTVTYRDRSVYIVTGNSLDNVEFTQDNSTELLLGTDRALIETTYDLGKYLSSTGPILPVHVTAYEDQDWFLKMVLPGIIQWSARHYFYLETSKSYLIIVTAAEQHLNSIAVVTPDNAFQVDELSNSRTSVIYTEFDAGNDTSNNYGVAYADLSISVNVDITGWYEFYSEEESAKFGIYIVEVKDEPVAILPFGMRFPCVDAAGDIVSCDPSPAKDTSDKHYGSLTTRLTPVKLAVSDTRTFSGNVKILHRQGCYSNEAGQGFPVVSPFKSTYNDAYKREMETYAFRIFRFKKTHYIFFRLTFRICVDETGDCEVSCTGREKRSTESHHVDLKITVTDDIEEDITPGKRQERCESIIIYWIPHVLLLMIIIIEVLATSYFLVKKWKLKQS